MNKQIKILVNKINRLKDYINKHQVRASTVSQLFTKFVSAIYCFNHFLNKDIDNPDNLPLEQQEWHDHIGSTEEVNGLINMDAYDRQQVYGPNYERNIAKMNTLYNQDIKYYIIKGGNLEPLDQETVKAFVNHFAIKQYFPEVTA